MVPEIAGCGAGAAGSVLSEKGSLKRCAVDELVIWEKLANSDEECRTQFFPDEGALQSEIADCPNAPTGKNSKMIATMR